MADDGENNDGENDDGYKVGYRQPPKEHQFLPGESGRTRKRGKRGKNYATRRDAMLDQTVTFAQNGRQRKLDTFEASLAKIREGALKDGHHRVLFKIVEFARERHEEELARAAILERRALEEHELAMLKEALPRLQAKLQADDGGTHSS